MKTFRGEGVLSYISFMCGAKGYGCFSLKMDMDFNDVGLKVWKWV